MENIKNNKFWPKQSCGHDCKYWSKDKSLKVTVDRKDLQWGLKCSTVWFYHIWIFMDGQRRRVTDQNTKLKSGPKQPEIQTCANPCGALKAIREPYNQFYMLLVSFCYQWRDSWQTTSETRMTDVSQRENATVQKQGDKNIENSLLIPRREKRF